jgi:hypothetical protein
LRSNGIWIRSYGHLSKRKTEIGCSGIMRVKREIEEGEQNCLAPIEDHHMISKRKAWKGGEKPRMMMARVGVGGGSKEF